MTEKQNILVFPCGSEIGLELFHSLSSSTHVRLFGASSVSSNHGKYLYENYIEGLPYVNDSGFVAAINRIIDEYQIDFIFPAMDSVLLGLAADRERLNCRVIVSPSETCNICCSKRLTYKKFGSFLRVPQLYNDLRKVSEWPIFIKPDFGYGSRGTQIARSYEEAKFHIEKEEGLLAMEYLPGIEYTIDCFTDRNGRLRFAGARERTRIQNGISVNSCPVKDGVFYEIAEIINKSLKFRGVWFYQLKKSVGGELALMEIAPRVAGTMALYRSLGVNFALLSVFDAVGVDVELLFNDCDIEIDRALGNRYKIGIDYRHLYIDLDDCLICGGKVNLQAVALLYQCLNRNIQIHLLTRHADTVGDTLKRHRLTGLFDEIIHLRPDELKSAYIKHSNAVFIDDSFSERKEVKDVRGIPVFAPDAIECLMD